jgi:5-methylcytosine-specific restriction protein A
VAIKAVSKERIHEALREFDRELRSKQEWLGWEVNSAHRYSIDLEGVQYPAKQIVSLATGVPVSEFSGSATNSYLEKRGFKVVLLRVDSEVALQFTPGAVYDRKTEINGPFGGSRQSGISASATHPAIFIFTGDSGEQYGYADDWEDGAYLYTGEGQRGDMTLTRGNRALAEHAENGKAIYLFESLGKGNGNRYKGEFSCADILERIQPDVDGHDRTAFVFRLVPVENAEQFIGKDSQGEAELPLSLAAAREAALAACKPVTDNLGQSAPRKIYLRSRKIAHYVLMRADGTCESCEKPAPFKKKDGSHYLEPHHVNRLSDGGLDHPRYVGAVCPNCHREIHSGVHGAAVNDRLKQRIYAIEN